MNLEVEKTYTFSQSVSDMILETLKTIENNNKDINLKKIKSTCTIHIMIADKRTKYKNRIKVLFNNHSKDKVKTIYSPKLRISNIEDALQTYLENDIDIDTINETCFFPMNIPVKAVYFKQKMKFKYITAGQKVNIAVDAIVSVNPIDIKIRNERYYNMEIEASDLEKIDYIESTYLSDIKKYIKYLGKNESKDEIASFYCECGTYLHFNTRDELISFARHIRNELIID